MLKCLSCCDRFVVPAHIEVIGKEAFRGFHYAAVFAKGSRLREIGERAFFCASLKSLCVPASVGILGDRCCEHCSDLATVTFEEISNLKKIGERAFAFSLIESFTIPASLNEFAGSAFWGCPLEAINIAAGNRSFVFRGNTLLTSDGTEIVKCFGVEGRIIVPREVEVLQNSCFQSLRCLTEVSFGSGSKLRRIGRSALSGCESLRSIVLPVQVSEIDESAFKDCIGLEDCSLCENVICVKIGQEAFLGCISLRSFDIPNNVEGIGANCFTKCPSLSRLTFGSGDTLKRIVRDMTLDDALEHLGIMEISGLFRIEIEADVCDLSFPGWVPVADTSLHLTLARSFS
jgi:hypothetical protein